MELYTATLIITKHLEWLDDKKHCPKVNEEKLKEAIELLTNLVKKLSLGVVVERSEQLKNKIMPRPTYHPASTEGIYSPMLAEREVDDARDGYKRQMQFWWEKLTAKQQREEWYKDGSQLGFYVSKPKYLRKSKLA